MNMNYEVKTDKSFEKAVEDLKQNLSSRNFGVLWEMNFKDKLKEKNLDFDTNFKVLEVCNPKQAKEVLDKNIEVGYFLPCKMVVYEKNKTVLIGMLKPTQLIEMMGDGELSSIAGSVEKELKLAIDEMK
ncbi:MAG TPA: hypothetical protein DHN33_05560 [Eubacteriaceae bacterium]|nr:hypothetical protein [Eubacteriaceae bacterium]